MALGWSVQTFMTTANTTVQLWTDPAMRGRVMAIYMAILNGCTLFGAPFVGGSRIVRRSMVADGRGHRGALAAASASGTWCVIGGCT